METVLNRVNIEFSAVGSPPGTQLESLHRQLSSHLHLFLRFCSLFLFFSSFLCLFPTDITEVRYGSAVCDFPRLIKARAVRPLSLSPPVTTITTTAHDGRRRSNGQSWPWRRVSSCIMEVYFHLSLFEMDCSDGSILDPGESEILGIKARPVGPAASSTWLTPVSLDTIHYPRWIGLIESF